MPPRRPRPRRVVALSPAVLERDADLAGAEIVERRLRDRAREHMAPARLPEPCSCGGLPGRDDEARWRCTTCGKPTKAPRDLPARLRAAISRVVAEAGGTDEDARDLAEVYVRAVRSGRLPAGGVA